jgi:hypothetical protein
VFGGEMVFNGNQRWLGGEYSHMLKMVEEAHFSWVGPYCPALEPSPSPQFNQRAAELVRRMGYQFALTEIRHDGNAVLGSELKIAINGENQGVAPFYYPWTIELALLDRAGKPAARLATKWDLRKWLPGKFVETAVLKLPATLDTPGDFRLALGIIDPWTKLPSIQLANDLERQNGWTILSTVKLTAR